MLKKQNKKSILTVLCLLSASFIGIAETPGKINVGIFNFDIPASAASAGEEKTFGESGIAEALESEKEMETVFIRTLEEAEKFDVLILPQTDAKIMTEEFKKKLRQLVETQGKGLLVTHDAVGYRSFGDGIFPEIAKGISHMPFSNKAILTVNGPLDVKLEVGEVFTHSYSDHISMECGPKGKIVARGIYLDPDSGYEMVGEPVLILGFVGKGHYAASGIMFGWGKIDGGDHRFTEGVDQEMKCQGVERQLLINLIRWLVKKNNTPIAVEKMKKGEKLTQLGKVDPFAWVNIMSDADKVKAKAFDKRKTDILPYPKEIEWAEENISLAKAVIITSPNADEKILLGSNDIIQKAKKLGGSIIHAEGIALERLEEYKRPLIFIGQAGTPFMENIAKHFTNASNGELKLTSDSPGREGYVIRFFSTENGDPRIVLAGSDAQGALNACYTFLYLLKKDKNCIYAVKANIRDWPDFGERSAGRLYTFASAAKSSLEGNGKFDYFQKTKAFIDFIRKRKLNSVRILQSWEGILRNKELLSAMHFRELCDYGRKVGVRVGILMHIGSLSLPQADCPVATSHGVENYLACCLGEDAQRRMAEAYSKFCREYRPGFISIHDIDGDPFSGCGTGGCNGWWVNRCKDCRTKYPNDNDWDKAVINMYLNICKAVKEASPDTTLEFVQWPYHAAMLSGEWRLYKGATEKYQSFMTKLANALPKDVAITVREGSRSQLELWNEASNKHKKFLVYYPYNGLYCWWVGDWGRDLATMFTGNRNDLCMNEGNWLWMYNEMSALIWAQYAWDVNTPGSIIWKNRKDLYKYNNTRMKRPYHPYVDGMLIPMIARDLYGSEAGPFVSKALLTNIDRNMYGTVKDSRWNIDINGKKRAGNGCLIDPVTHFTEMRKECQVLYDNMKEGIRYSQKDPFRQWVMNLLWFKARQMKNRGEGFYHWALAVKYNSDGKRDNAQKNLLSAKTFFQEEYKLMEQAESEGFSSEITTQFGYWPMKGEPLKIIGEWAKMNKYEI